MGPDGHIASLIPGSPTLDEGLDPASPRLVLEAPGDIGSPPMPRITLTLRALLMSKILLILAAGGEKRRVIERALGGEDFPVRALLRQDQTPVRILWSS